MNTMAKAYANRLSVSQMAGFHVSRRSVALVVFCVSILLTAFGVVYMKDLNRRLFIQYQGLQQVQQQYETTWGKLLLEQSTWATQSRVQAIATQSFGMVTPTAKGIVVVEE